MTTEAIKWLLYDLMRTWSTNEEIAAKLAERGATFEDMVTFAVEQGRRLCTDIRCELPSDHDGPCKPEPEDDEDDEPTEPDEDAITTRDDRKFYQYGKMVLSIGPDDDRDDALVAYMNKEQFWPDCWSISDHGNPHLIDLNDAYTRNPRKDN